MSAKYRPLFELLNGKHTEVDTVVLTGGRYSGKSKVISIFSSISLVDFMYRVLFSRFTNTSIGDSIKREVSNTIDELGYTDYVVDNKNAIDRIGESDAIVSFKGIKTGSRGQTANLKSLSGFNCWIVDEAEEIPSFDAFEKVFLSIRSKTKRNITILSLNPQLRTHWIFEEFFEKRMIHEGFCGIKDNVLYIHTSYLDVNRDFIPDNIYNKYQLMKENEPNRYNHIVMGGWLDAFEGLVFPSTGLNRFKLEQVDFTDTVTTCAYVDVADKGTDSHCAVIGKIINNRVYIVDVLFTKLPTTENVAMTISILNEHKPEFTQIESNFGGSLYIQNINANQDPKINGVTALIPIHNSTKKHTRIFTSSNIINKNFYFREDYERGSDYDLFMRELTKYVNVDVNEHDDAPDSISGLARMILNYFPDTFDS